MKKVATSCIALLVFVSLASAQESERLSAGAIMNRAITAYRSCRSYSDQGQVSVAAVTGSGRPEVVRFFTAFVRPARFRFEVLTPRSEADDWDRFIAWKEGDIEKSWWSLNQHEAPLSETLHSFVDLSRGAAQTIPQLLLPGLFPNGSAITYLTDLRLSGWQKVDGRWAYQLQGKRQGQPLTIWIDSREFLILKIYQEERIRSLTLATTTTYKPQIDVGVAPGNLSFNPPSDNATARAAVSNPGSATRPLLHNYAKTKPEDPELSLGRTKKKPDRMDFSVGGSRGKKLILNANRDDVVQIDTTLVALDVLVLDQQKNIVQGLTARDFIVTEDGFPERITTFAHGDDPNRPRSIVLIIDYSGSQLPFFNESVAAAKTLVDQLNPKDRMAIVTDDVTVLVDFTADKAKLKEKLESLWDAVANKRRLGRSAQYSALMATLDRLGKEKNVHPIIIFQTDGDELATLRPDASYPPPLPVTSNAPESEFSIADVFATALRSRATIYTVIPGFRLIELPLSEQLVRAKLDWEARSVAREKLRPDSPKSDRPAPEKIWPAEHWQELAATTVWVQAALVNLSNISGGWAEFLEKSDQAADLYARILADINQRYIVGYQPVNKERDGKLRRVKVEVRGHPEYRVVGRSSYYAPGPERQ